MRFLCVADGFLFNDPCGAWYTTATFPLRFISDELPCLTEFRFWGRLRRVDSTSGLFRLDNILDPSRVTVRFMGPIGQTSGPAGFIRHIAPCLGSLRDCVQWADVMWVRVPSIYSTLAWTMRTERQLKIVQQIGHAAKSLGSTYPAFRVVGSALDRLSARFACQADLAAFVSTELQMAYGKRAKRSMVFHNSRLTREMLWRRDTKTPHKPVRILYCGRISLEKGLQYAIEALSYVPDAVLWVAGRGAFMEACRKQSASLGVEDRVVWLGQVEWGATLFRVMRECDVLVVPSVTEGMPQCIVDAMGQSLPVIGTAVGGIPELIRPGCNGVLVPPEDSKAIARAIEGVACSSLWASLCEGAAKTAEKQTIDLQLGRMCQFIRDWWHYAPRVQRGVRY